MEKVKIVLKNKEAVVVECESALDFLKVFANRVDHKKEFSIHRESLCILRVSEVAAITILKPIMNGYGCF